MAIETTGSSYFEFGNLANIQFLYDQPWCGMGFCRPTKADQSSIIAKWAGAASGRQLDFGQGSSGPGGTSARLRHGTDFDLTVTSAFTLGEWHAYCFSGDGSGNPGPSIAQVYVLRLSDGNLASGSRSDLIRSNASNMTEPVRALERNTQFPISFQGGFDELVIMDRVPSETDFRFFAKYPREALRQMGQSGAVQLHFRPGFKTAAGLHVDLSRNRYNATELGANITKSVGAPTIFQKSLTQLAGEFEPAPPPMFVAAWAEQGTIGDGFGYAS